MQRSNRWDYGNFNQINDDITDHGKWQGRNDKAAGLTPTAEGLRTGRYYFPLNAHHRNSGRLE